MHNDQKAFWNEFYSNKGLKYPEYDGWLDEYIKLLASKKSIIDLGCGNGVDTLFLSQNLIKTVACDFSTYALENLVSVLPDAFVLQFDMRNGLPFLHDSLDVIIADLSLHYFTMKDTRKIIFDVKRALKTDGLIICRMNAYDTNMDYTKYTKLEDDYFLIDGCTKRFFTIESTRDLFSDWNITKLQMSSTSKYRSSKPAIICEARK